MHEADVTDSIKVCDQVNWQPGIETEVHDDSINCSRTTGCENSCWVVLKNFAIGNFGSSRA